MEQGDETIRRRRELPVYWYNKASDLRAAAGAVWVAIEDGNPDSRLGLASGFSMAAACPRVYRMLCGLSLELCFKAIVVAKGGATRFSHNLLELSQLAGVQFDQGSIDLLRVLSDAIIWVGKYPIPKGNDAEARAKYESASRAIHASLFDTEPLGQMGVLSPNHALSWVGFSQLWETTSNEYWQHHRDFPIDAGEDESR